MKAKFNQIAKQSQKMAVTPELLQLSKFLSLTHLEMNNEIANTILENPCLEEVEPYCHQNEPDFKDKEEGYENFNFTNTIKEDDFDWNGYIESYNNTSTSPSDLAVPSPVKEPPLEQTMGLLGGESLQDHLGQQLKMEELSEEDFALGLEIIHNLSEEGFLETPLENLAKSQKWGRERAKKVRNIIQHLEPFGCASDNWQECLLFQAKMMGESSPLWEKVIREYMGKWSSMDYKKAALGWGENAHEVKNILQILKNFNPRPGLLFSEKITRYIVPDVYVTQKRGKLAVKVNKEGMPPLRISQHYKKLLSHPPKDKEAVKYVREKMEKALLLLKSIGNRESTLQRVAQFIVSKQQDFFKKGNRHLKPLLMKGVAFELEIDNSTVSRAVSNKYMHTPKGIFPMKYFFSREVACKNGKAVSRKVVQDKIKEWIDNEDSKNPLSDQKISDLLAEEGLSVARRTVAKYRGELGVASKGDRGA